MRLKKLELYGFKSFADKTEVLFDRGVTCVVGPNGCGKSNISDSIRWVLGERSAKLLRGARMEDVIFSGTDFRKPVAYAEVSLTLDNSDRGLAIDYAEVTLTRRLHRSGESEYLINKTACRLKDIQDLILDTGIGSSSYSMIEQGRIDYILNADPDEKRFLIEEAAGISKYKVKKEEAIRKLEKTEENLLRLRDIIHEVHRNIQYAERQAKRAKRYQDQFERLKSLETRKAFYDLARISLEAGGLDHSQEAQREKVLACEREMAKCRETQRQLDEDLKLVMARFSEEENRRFQILGRLDRHRQQLEFHGEKRLEFANRRGQINQEQVTLETRREESLQELNQKRQEFEGLASAKDAAGRNLDEARSRLGEAEAQYRELKGRLDAIKNLVYEAAGETSSLRNRYHRVSALLETNVEQKKKHEAGRDRYLQEMNDWEIKSRECLRMISEIEEKTAGLGHEKDGLSSRLADIDARITRMHAEILAREKEIHEREMRAALLEEIDASTGAGTESVLEKLSAEERSAVRILRSVLSVRAGYEWALESVLGDFARTLIADDGTTASKLLAVLKENNSLPAGLLIRDFRSWYEFDIACEKPDHPDLIAPLLDLVEIQPEYRPVMESFFERVFVIRPLTAENFEALFSFADDHILVTADGSMLGPYGRIFHRPGVMSDEQSFFKRGAEIGRLRDEIQVLNDDLKRLSAERELLSAEHAACETELAMLSERETQLKISKEALESERKSFSDRIGTYQRELDLIFFESREMELKEEEAGREKNALEQQLKEALGREQELQARQNNFLRDLEIAESRKIDALRDSSEKQSSIDKLIDRGRFLEESIRFLEQHEREASERISQLGDETDSILKREEELGVEDERIKVESSALGETLRECDVSLEILRQEKEKISVAIQGEEEVVKRSQEERHAIEQVLHESDMKRMDLGYQERNIFERMLQSFKIDLHQLKPEEYPLSEEESAEVTAEIEALREKVETIGAVNLLAIEEYEELKGRYDFLIAQQKDLEDARDQLLEVIRKINRTTRGLFAETFEKVQTYFKEYFQVLFNGGEARLVLLDETNPLESGVEIVVRPPGKKLQSISLMSGGEKAMTALALLFALFRIKPSPFCVLDEADAPLDEANIDRFLNVVQSFLSASQFIIVTHNRKTIAMGDALYGVTMEEAGISKIVSVKVAAAEKGALQTESVVETKSSDFLSSDSVTA